MAAALSDSCENVTNTENAACGNEIWILYKLVWNNMENETLQRRRALLGIAVCPDIMT
jgi:hypothetical protein